jgi:ABC-type protease/lipase transport system fused ATPase/permease subunit
MHSRLQITRRAGFVPNRPRTALDRIRNFLIGLVVAALAGAFLLAAFLLGFFVLAIIGIVVAAAVVVFIVRASLGLKNHQA